PYTTLFRSELFAGLLADEPELLLLVVPAAPDAGVAEESGVERGVGAASRVVPVPLSGVTRLVVPIAGVWLARGVWLAAGVPALRAPEVPVRGVAEVLGD